MAIETKNTEHSMDLVALVEAAALFIEEAKADGKFDSTDGFKLLSLAPPVVAAMAGIQKIPAEIKSMSGEEKDAVLVAFSMSIRHLFEAVT